ncbi:type II toxin-antitoxin system VapC family toxin [Sphingosinicella terrae]|uniref:type II toxin-antitoxin system VapC family toxin n=1 Tax=Sphingosinicella terrae TaxID=2172047 RepID=UPI000E0D978A|nr:PIN domain-containing protein [Sphingosinicella terrae]
MSLRIEALLDSNVLIAVLAEAHEHHEPSFALIAEENGGRFAISAHSYAEAYSTLTRRGESGLFRFTPAEAISALESLRGVTTLVGLTPAQTFDTIRDHASTGGIGARLCDRLIGQAAAANGIVTIVTWKVTHMRSLFPDLEVLSPLEFQKSGNKAT